MSEMAMRRAVEAIEQGHAPAAAEILRRALTEDTTVPLDEYARQCREICDRDAQAGNGIKCGETYTHTDGDAAFSFCGFHFGPVIGAH